MFTIAGGILLACLALVIIGGVLGGSSSTNYSSTSNKPMSKKESRERELVDSLNVRSIVEHIFSNIELLIVYGKTLNQNYLFPFSIAIKRERVIKWESLTITATKTSKSDIITYSLQVPSGTSKVFTAVEIPKKYSIHDMKNVIKLNNKNLQTLLETTEALKRFSLNLEEFTNPKNIKELEHTDNSIYADYAKSVSQNYEVVLRMNLVPEEGIRVTQATLCKDGLRVDFTVSLKYYDVTLIGKNEQKLATINRLVWEKYKRKGKLEVVRKQETQSTGSDPLLSH